jgi:hypothetical protein
METLDSYEFQRGSRVKYDYEAILDGRPHRLKRGEDFGEKVTIKSLRSMLHKKASDFGKSLNTQVESDDALVVQAVVKHRPKQAADKKKAPKPAPAQA